MPLAKQRVPVAMGGLPARIRTKRPPPGAAGEPSYAYLFNYTTPYSVAAGGSTRIGYQQFNTNALGTVFSTGGATTPGHNTAGDLYLHCLAEGYYQIYADVLWEDGVYNRFHFIDTTLVAFNQAELTAGAAWATKVSTQLPLQERLLHGFVDQYTLDHSPTFRFRASIIAYNKDAGARNVIDHTLAAVYWPMSNDFENSPDTDLVYG